MTQLPNISDEFRLNFEVSKSIIYTPIFLTKWNVNIAMNTLKVKNGDWNPIYC